MILRSAGLRSVHDGCPDEVDQQLAEARVVTGEVVEGWPRQDVGWAIVDRGTVEIDRTAGPEVDRRDGEEPVEVREQVNPGTVVVAPPADRQKVWREVALLVDNDIEDVGRREPR